MTKQPFSPANYSLNWAAGVIKELKNKHARGCNIVEEVLGITDRNLAKYLATGDPLYPKLRQIIKLLDNLSLGAGKHATKAMLVANLGAMADRPGFERIKKRLTDLENSAMLEEQVKRGVGEANKADPTHPYVLEDGLVQYTLFECV